MRYSTIIVIDIETNATLYRDCHDWDGSVDLAKPKQSPQEGIATSVAQQDQTRMGKMYDTAQDTLGQFEGPVQNSPYYKSLLASSTDATSNAYQNAQAASADRAKTAGFGYASPIGQAASRETQGAEAAKLAELPAQTYAQAAPMSLEAAKTTGGLGEAAGAQGTQNLATAGGLNMDYQKRKEAFWNKIANVGIGAATGGVTGNLGALTSAVGG